MGRNPLGAYEFYKILESADVRVRERHIGHIRALKEREYALEDGERHHGIVSRITARLLSRRPVVAGPPAIRYDAHELTDYVCRLVDGTMGRVAIRQSDGGWVAVCVAV
ncbi:MAG: hypothetical protein A2X23_03195 [Chloroflexi bacterium GWC2_73_18]|nr:MAG: hypothetical protein A2X23_03195 [Chloroflexi bacterium GWC2_73_18]